MPDRPESERRPPFSAQRFFLFSVLPALFFASCFGSGKAKIAEIDFPPTYVVGGVERFAVVVHPYAALRDQPGENGVTLGHCRRGEVFEVTGTSFVESGGTRVLWVCLEGGWISRPSVTLFSTRAQAETASLALRADGGG